MSRMVVFPVLNSYAKNSKRRINLTFYKGNKNLIFLWSAILPGLQINELNKKIKYM